MSLPIVRLKKGREKKILGRYPWVQREEVVSADSVEPGGLAELRSHDGEFLARGTFNPKSRFPFRVFSLEPEALDQAFFERRFRAAWARRADLEGTNAFRAIFSEADGVPGLIADQYGDTLVVQVRSLGMERMKPLWIPALISASGAAAIYEKSEMEGRKEEGLGPFVGALHGNPAPEVPFEEDGFQLVSLVADGLKTGWYLDQRDSRRRLSQRVRPGDKVLDCFCFSGGFSLHAARAGADCLGLDIAPAALAAARRHADMNQVDARFEEANVFEWLEQEGELYDWMILDPPAIAKSRDRRDSLKWAVWKLVHRGVSRLKPGGRMVVCSCSYQLDLPELLSTIRLAANDRQRTAVLEEVTVQGQDHPISLAFPESWYLKCAWVRIEP